MKNFKFEHGGKEYWYSRSVAVVVIVATCFDGYKHILITKRGKNTPDFQGHWCMPCGYVDFDETVEQAAVREVFEETNIIIKPEQLKLLKIDSSLTGKQNITIRYFYYLNNNSQILSSKNADNGEVDKVKWLDVDLVDNYKWAFGHDKLIEKYWSKEG